MPGFVFGSLQFDSPTREITATQLSEVLPVLDFAEREAKAGAYVGVMLSYETVRRWCDKFGKAYADGLTRRRARTGDKWHLDEVFLKIKRRDPLPLASR